MDREFDSQYILEMLSQRGLSYVVPKRMQTSEKAQAKRLLKKKKDRYETDRKLHLGDNEWHSTTLIYRRKENSEHTDHRQYSVFMMNRGSGHLTEYGYRWEIVSGYKSIKRFMLQRPRSISASSSSISRSPVCCTQFGERLIYSYRCS
ncbi:transposase [Natrinema sp. J7-2]|nr:transposase [Natrinema sp. J7-2]